ncbi:hypothetical protein DSO57_1010475 [Entomophthora muscae]|uniref:Uncharacterized protein n=1 Tax=Entomophthora muscae TaxID=34485 RepID=A0ACC2SJ88_9FUNG|nr:hypothetical protein DSO57_1010475 [Entomophthora muscae]
MTRSANTLIFHSHTSHQLSRQLPSNWWHGPLLLQLCSRSAILHPPHSSNTILACYASLYFLSVYFEPSLSEEEQYNASSFHTPRLMSSLVTSIFSMVLTGAVSPLALALVTQLSPSTVPPLTWYISNLLGSARAMTMSIHVPSYLSVYSAEPAVIASDHHCLLVEIAPSHTTDAAPAFGLEHYHLCCLDNPAYRLSFVVPLV